MTKKIPLFGDEIVSCKEGKSVKQHYMKKALTVVSAHLLSSPAQHNPPLPKKYLTTNPTLFKIVPLH